MNNNKENQEARSIFDVMLPIALSFLILVIVYKFTGFSLNPYYIILIALIALIAVFFFPYRVEEYTEAAVYSFGKRTRNNVAQGLHFKRIWENVRFVSTKISEPKNIHTREIELPDSSKIKYDLKYSYQIIDVDLFISGVNHEKRFEESVSQALEQFTGDPFNPPRNWNEARDISPEKYVAKTIYFLEGKDYPRYESQEIVDRLNEAITDESKKVIKGMYVREEHFDRLAERELTMENDSDYVQNSRKKVGEKAQKTPETYKEAKEINMQNASELMRGTGKYSLYPENMGIRIVQLNINKPIPGEELDKALRQRSDIEQEVEKEKKRIELENKQQEKYRIEFRNLVERIKELTTLGISPREAALRVMEMDEDLSKRLKSVNENVNTYLVDGNLGEIISSLTNLFSKLGGKS